MWKAVGWRLSILNPYVHIFVGWYIANICLESCLFSIFSAFQFIKDSTKVLEVSVKLMKYAFRKFSPQVSLKDCNQMPFLWIIESFNADIFRSSLRRIVYVCMKNGNWTYKHLNIHFFFAQHNQWLRESFLI